ncbi:hypothetical protein Tco_1357241, partial [Tanacetum coccineum]
MLTVVNSFVVIGDSEKRNKSFVEIYNECFELEAELDIDNLETINIELEHSVANLLTENKHLHKEREHLKNTYKELYDSIKKRRVQTKDHSDSLIAQLNQNCLKNVDLNAQIQEKVFAIAALKNKLRKLKEKNMLENAAPVPNPNVIAPRMFKLNLEPLAPKVLKNRDAHIDYIRHSMERVDTLREIVKNARALRPLDSNLHSSCQMKSSTSASRSHPSGNTKNNRISRTTSSDMKNKVEDQPRSVKSSSNKKNHAIEPICNAIQIVLWYLDSECSKHMTGNRSQLINFVHKFL